MKKFSYIFGTGKNEIKTKQWKIFPTSHQEEILYRVIHIDHEEIVQDPNLLVTKSMRLVLSSNMIHVKYILFSKPNNS